MTQTIKLVKSGEGFYLYQTTEGNELWKGKITGKYSFRVGYLSDVENFSIGVFEAKEELKSLAEEVEAEFGGR